MLARRRLPLPLRRRPTDDEAGVVDGEFLPSSPTDARVMDMFNRVKAPEPRSDANVGGKLATDGLRVAGGVASVSDPPE